MLAQTILVEKLNTFCRKSNVTKTDLDACCKILLENFKFDCVFVAFSGTPEEPPIPMGCEGKEEIMETCLYRLGVEERHSLAKLPMKAYQDITGKPVFNKSGSLRIQKPNSGIFMVRSVPKKCFILLGYAHQNSQGYDVKLMEELSGVWKNWQETLEKALTHNSLGGVETKIAASPSLPPLEKAQLVLEKPVPAAPAPVPSITSGNLEDGRRPVILVDEVTRLFNKDYFSECLAIEVERAKRYSRMMSLMFLSVTPNNGASASLNENLVATQVAEILAKSLRRVDVICRLEKDKYAIVLPDTAHNTYGIIAKRIFKFFKLVMGDAPLVYLNISASTYPKHAADHKALLESAEKLLGQAKEVGANKAVLPE
jgi:diguanylate cyclase (GGDEF)-like protein